MENVNDEKNELKNEFLGKNESLDKSTLKTQITKNAGPMSDKDDLEEDKLDIDSKTAELLKKVKALKLLNVDNSFSDEEVKSAAFPESLKIEEEKERIKFERRAQMRAYKRTELLLKEVLMAEKTREMQERSFTQIETKLDKDRESMAVQFELEKAEVQKKIDALKQEMFEFGKSVQEKEIIDGSTSVDKSNKEQWFSFLLRNKKKLPIEKNETLTKMVEKMQVYNTEIETLQTKFNNQVALNLAEFEEAKAHVTKAKQEENFAKSVVKMWAASLEEKNQPAKQAVAEGVKQIVELNSDSKAPPKLTRRQRVVQALRQIYYYLCKKLRGEKRKRAHATGKNAIDKELQKDYTLDIYVNGVRASPSRNPNPTL